MTGEPAALETQVVARVLEALAAERAQRRRRLMVTLGALVITGALSTAVWTSSAWAQASCTQTLPAPLVTFCADAPALASQVNGNTQQLVTWVQQKVGTVGSANVAITGTLSVTGDLTPGRITPAYSSWAATGAGGAAIVNDNGSFQALMVVGNNSAGGNRRVRLYDDLFVDQNIVVGNRIDIGLELVRCTSAIECLCPVGKAVLSGGCWTDNAIRYSRPMQRGTQQGWICARANDGNLFAVYAVCGRVNPMGGAITTEP